MNFFTDKDIIVQESVQIVYNNRKTSGITLVTTGNEVILEREELERALEYLNSMEDK